jgi:acyl phosphate:glycerol-3-phosphate acyltransferase
LKVKNEMNMDKLSLIGWVAVGSYLCGSLPFGYWVGKLKGIDIREHGSGNIGATNVIRVLGKKIGIPVFLLDMLKGVLPVVVAGYYAQQCGILEIEWIKIIAGLSAIFGHMFTFWLSFKGGKGVATGAGVMLAIMPLETVLSGVVWYGCLKLWRYVSLASMIAAGVIPLIAMIRMYYSDQWSWVLLIFSIIIAVLVIVKHHSNIKRLLAGTESKVKS